MEKATFADNQSRANELEDAAVEPFVMSSEVETSLIVYGT
jgi:hypothetical protein